jgi:hypothetical protein
LGRNFIVPIAVRGDFHIWSSLCSTPHIYRVKLRELGKQGKSFPQYTRLFHRIWQVIHRSEQNIALYLLFA